ncbi:MAG: hypothetical protein ABI688_07745, partial [Bacteroidota bacterium]
TDAEHSNGQLKYEWQTFLRHNVHEHAEPIDTSRNTSTVISRIGCSGSDNYYWIVKLKVTDAAGLSTVDSAKIFPACNGTPDLTSTQFFSTTQVAPGGTVDEVIGIRNVGTVATPSPIVFTVTNYAAITGLSAALLGGSTVTIGFTTYTLSNASWTVTTTPSALTFTSNAGFTINPGTTAFVGIRVTRAAGARGIVTHSSTVTGGTGGGETYVNNNSISNMLLKN